MLDPELVAPVEATVRGIASAARALRLYPPTSPIPRGSVETAVASLRAYLDQQPSLTLNVAREGFTCRGTTLAASTSGGGADLADMLSSHGVAEVLFLPGCGPDDLLGFLKVIMHSPETVRADGGVAASLASAGASAIRVVTVSLTVAGQMEEPPVDGDVDEFFRELASDPDKLATWLAAAAAGDPATLSEGLDELANAADNPEAFYATLAAAFEKQETDAKDVLLGIGMEQGRTQDLIGGMLSQVPVSGVSSSLNGGVFGKNMLSLSSALTRLPFGERMEDIIAEVRASLPDFGHDTHELGFLDHMMDVRQQSEPEAALTAANPTYAAVAAASRVDVDALSAKRTEVADSVAHTASRSVPPMLALLDQQRDFKLYVKSLDALAALVPHLVHEGELATATRVLKEIAERENRTSQPWPELTSRLRAAMTVATGRGTMAALLDALETQTDAVAYAHRILKLADDAGKLAFLEEALSRHDERALDLAESLLGRRTLDLLVAAAPKVGVAQIALLVRRLTSHGDASVVPAIEAMLRRPEEMARAEVAEGLAGTANPSMVRVLTTLLNDASPKVVSAAAHSIARTTLPGCAEALATRLEALDVDGRDFALGRELIACLAQMRQTAASQTLRRLAERRALIKRGHFLEVQQLAREALAAQERRAAR